MHWAHRTALLSGLLIVIGASCVGTIGSEEGNSTANMPASRARRLTRTEYVRSIEAIFGVSVDPVALPPDPLVEGFDNDASLLTVSSLHFDAYVKTAQKVAVSVMESPERRAAVLGCEPVGMERQTCLNGFIERIGGLAYRRPLTADESSGLHNLAQLAPESPDPYAGPRLVLEGLLESPSFLFRLEIGAPDPALAGKNRLTGPDLAAKLAFFLWAQPPDAALLEAALSGKLDTDEGLEEVARGMLADPRAEEGMRNFYSQWLRLRELEAITRDPAQYPEWSEDLRASMDASSRLYVDEILWSDGDFLELLDAPYAYVDSRLASIYGLPDPGEGFHRVDLPADGRRAGLLTQPTILTLTAPNRGLMHILRGKYVRDVLLCDPPPPPPANIPPLPPEKGGQSERDRLKAHSDNGACAACHAKLDPVGFGFEQYDLLGEHRETDSQGFPVTGEGNLAGFTPAAFKGPVELASRLRNAPETRACVVKHALRYAYGRGLAPTDAATIDSVTAQFEAAPAFQDMVVALVLSDGFRVVRTPEGGCQ